LLYGFTGSNPELLTGELEKFLDNLKTVKLEINYRSTDEIIEKSQKLIAHNYSDLGGPYPQEFMKTVSGTQGQGENIQFEIRCPTRGI
jgi:DNA helicase-2/ATP-dependent DNA helicase PcrA